jgi:CheY-like chemotaxis protein
MLTDARRLQQVLRNLLSNAIKFTPSGRVELRVDWVPAREPAGEEYGDYIDFTVVDTGIGIAPGKLSQIFEAFQQADGTTNRKYGGTGLGLSISREIAGLLGGTIHAESTPGAGSTFRLRLPVAHPGADPRDTERYLNPTAATAVEAAQEPDWPRPKRLEEWLAGRPGEVFPGRRVLIVDDDIRNVFALTHVLGRIGMTVLYAENGREGIEVLERNPDVSLVLMDIMMPELDGYETISALRGTPRFAGLPIIALTAKAMPGDRERAIAGGASDYVPKPVDIDRLLSTTLRLLDPEERESASPQEAQRERNDSDAQRSQLDPGEHPPGR